MCPAGLMVDSDQAVCKWATELDQRGTRCLNVIDLSMGTLRYIYWSA